MYESDIRQMRKQESIIREYWEIAHNPDVSFPERLAAKDRMREKQNYLNYLRGGYLDLRGNWVF